MTSSVDTLPLTLIFIRIFMFRIVFGCFGYIGTSKLAVLTSKKQSEQTSCSDSVEIRLGSSFGCDETKLVLEDTQDTSVGRSLGSINLEVTYNWRNPCWPHQVLPLLHLPLPLKYL